MQDFRQNVASLTGLRGVAALWVATFHFTVSQPDYPLPNAFSLWTIIRHGYLAVDVFFVMSGFVMALSYSHFFQAGLSGRQYGVFMIRRVARIYPLYCLMTLIYVAQATYHDGFGALWQRGKTELVTNLLMIQSWGFGRSIIDQSWSISTEFAAYLIFPFITAALIFSSIRRASVCAGLCAAGLVAVSFAQRPTEYVPMGLFDIHPEQSVFPVLRCLSGFGLGMIIYRLAVFARKHGFLTPPAWCYGVTGVLLLSQMAPGLDLVSLALTPLFIFTLLGDNAVAKALGSGPLVFLGEISYAVYLIHGKVVPTLYGAILVWWPGATNTLGRVAAFYAGFILATIIIATIANRLVEVPARRWLRRLEVLFDPRAEQTVLASEAEGLSDIARRDYQVLRPGPTSINHRE